MRIGYSEFPSSSRAWVAVNTHPHRELLAIQNLRRQDFRTYCPMMTKRIRVTRREREVMRPMFPGYVFVAVSRALDQWRPLLSTYGVRRVLRCGNELSLLDDEFIQALRAREIGGAIVRPASPYEVGQQIRVKRGPFDGVVANIIELDERDRVIVLLDLLGKSVRAGFDIRDIVPGHG
jgi:transcriptional antiterminator RfaH